MENGRGEICFKHRQARMGCHTIREGMEIFFSNYANYLEIRNKIEIHMCFCCLQLKMIKNIKELDAIKGKLCKKG